MRGQTTDADGQYGGVVDQRHRADRQQLTAECAADANNCERSIGVRAVMIVLDHRSGGIGVTVT